MVRTLFLRGGNKTREGKPLAQDHIARKHQGWTPTQDYQLWSHTLRFGGRLAHPSPQTPDIPPQT